MNKKTDFDIAELQGLLNSFKRTMSDLYRKETATLHCSLSHLEIMQYIKEHNSPTMKDIAMFLRITPPSVTTLVEQMVNAKLVKRTTVPGDRRSVRVMLTPKAQKLSVLLQDKKTKLLQMLLAKLSNDQKQQLSSIISTLVQ